MQAPSMSYLRPSRPAFAGRRSLATFSSTNGAVPSRPGGGAARFSISSDDEVPSDTEGDVPVVGVRAVWRRVPRVPTSSPGAAGAVGFLSFDRPGGGCTRFNMAPSSSVVIASGPSSAIDTPSRFSRPAGGAARMFPSGVGGGGGPTGGDGAGGSGGSGGDAGGPSPADEPLGFSSLAPWALLYVGVCGGLFWAHEAFIKKKKPAPEAAPAAVAAAAAPVKSCCKKRGK